MAGQIKRKVMQTPPQRKMLFGRNGMGKDGVINQILRHRIEVGLRTAAERAPTVQEKIERNRIYNFLLGSNKKRPIMPQNAKGRR